MPLPASWSASPWGHHPRATQIAGKRLRGKYWWVRWAVLGVVAIVLAVEVALGWHQLAKAWMSLYEANWWWLLASVGAAAASMHSFAQIQRTLLKSAGVRVKQVRSEAAFYAANSLSTTLPGVRCLRRRSCSVSNASGAPPRWWRPGSW